VDHGRFGYNKKLTLKKKRHRREEQYSFWRSIILEERGLEFSGGGVSGCQE
jgi:hypothetical protein